MITPTVIGKNDIESDWGKIIYLQSKISENVNETFYNNFNYRFFNI